LFSAVAGVLATPKRREGGSPAFPFFPAAGSPQDESVRLADTAAATEKAS